MFRTLLDPYMNQFGITDPNLVLWLTLLLSVLIIWEVIAKSIGLWKSARNNQLGWFIMILIVNSIGILPLVYILWFQKKYEEKATFIIKEEPIKKKPAKKKK